MSPQPHPRMRRVNSVIREIVAEVVERLKDPRLELVTITDVTTSPDLRHAVVHFSTLRHEDAGEAAKALSAAAARLQAVVGKETRMKYVPKLEFRVDSGIIAGERIDSLIRELHKHEEGQDG